MKKLLYHNGQTIEFELTYKDVKRINLRVSPDGRVAVSAPAHVSISDIEGFVHQNADNILRYVSNLPAPEYVLPRNCISGENVAYLGSRLCLEVRQGDINSCYTDGDRLFISVTDTENADLRNSVLKTWLNSECVRIVSECCKKYYPLFGKFCHVFPDLKFSVYKSKWGSCTPKKNRLTFNLRLIHKPMSCIEYVVVHEFCHFIQLNHSKAFWTEVDKILPDRQKRIALLNNRTQSQ